MDCTVKGRAIEDVRTAGGEGSIVAPVLAAQDLSHCYSAFIGNLRGGSEQVFELLQAACSLLTTTERFLFLSMEAGTGL